MWCIPKLTPLFRERMDAILALYTEPLPEGHEVHNFDETPKQLLGTPRGCWRMMEGGTPKRTDYEYKRNGRRNIFVAVAPFQGTRTVKVTDRRTAIDTADFLWCYCMEEHGKAVHIHLILDNLNTHMVPCLRTVWGDEKTDAFFKHVTFHYTPYHASWLNLAELEINCLKAQGLKRRLETEALLKETATCIVENRNQNRRTLSWSFTKEKAQKKFPQLYV
jgi:DDE superfamily endonuclease